MTPETLDRNNYLLIDRLPPDKRAQLIAIGRQASERFGYAYQQIFDDHIQIFDFLAAQGATARMIGQMLAEIGIVRQDGSALPPGTVSSALSRARERASQQGGTSLHVSAPPGMHLQVAAGSGMALHDPATRGNDALMPTAEPKPVVPTIPVQPHSFPEIRRMPDASAGAQLPASTRRAAALLEQLRNKDHDQ